MFNENTQKENNTRKFNQFNQFNEFSQDKEDNSFSTILNSIVLENNVYIENNINSINQNSIDVIGNNEDKDLGIANLTISNKDYIYKDLSSISEKISIHNYMKKLRAGYLNDNSHK